MQIKGIDMSRIKWIKISLYVETLGKKQMYTKDPY